jgi:hypothetical protein
MERSGEKRRHVKTKEKSEGKWRKGGKIWRKMTNESEWRLMEKNGENEDPSRVMNVIGGKWRE